MFHHKYSKYYGYIGVLIALVFTAACSLQPFSSVRIKASPKICLPLGSKNITEDEVFKEFEEALKDTSGENTDKNIRLYRYQSGQDDKLRYLAHYPLESFDFDVNSYFNGDPLESGGGESGNTNLLSRKFDTEISIPKINENKSLAVNSADINQELLKTFNTDISQSVMLPVPVPGVDDLPPVNVNIDFEGFETIKLGAGSYLEISTRPNSTNVSYEITEAKMESYGQTVAGYITGYDVRFPLDNKTISKNVKLTLTVKNIKGGSGTAKISRKLDGTIIRATGVNAEPEITPAQGSVDIPLPDDFHSATIEVGELKLSIERPAGWTGITIKEQTIITQAGSGGLAINPADFQLLGTSVSLAKQTLNNQRTLTYEPKLKIKLADATYTYQENLSVNFNFSIDQFSVITMKNKADFNKEQLEPVPDGMKNWVKNIRFKTASVKIKLKNELPAENDITINLSSDCFKINPAQEQTFNPGEMEKEYKCNNGDAFDLDVEPLEHFDLTTAVLLPGYNKDDNTFTLKNIRTDSTIEFSGAVRFDLDWEKITLKKKDNQLVSFPKTGSRDVSDLTSKLKKFGIELEEIPVYFYAGSNSELLKNAKMDVKLAATMKNTSQDLIEKKNVPLKAFPAGTFTSDAKPFTGDIPAAMLSIKKGEPGVKATFTDIMNSYPNDLKLNCMLNMDEVTITREEYEKPENKNAKVNIDLLLDLPVGFKKVESNQELSLTEMFGRHASDSDLFGRSSPNDKSVFNNVQISDALRSIQISINFKNGLDVAPGFILRFKNDSGTAIEKKIMTAAGKQRIAFTSKEWKELLDMYPVSPELFLQLPQGSYSLKRNFELGASLTVLAETDINYKL